MKSLIFIPELVAAIRNSEIGTFPPVAIDPSKPTKGMTRRVMKPQPPEDTPDIHYRLATIIESSTPADVGKCKWQGMHKTEDWNILDPNQPTFSFPLQPGDIAYIREVFYQYGYWFRHGLTKKGNPKWSFVPEDEEILYQNKPPVVYWSSRDAKDPGIPCWYKRSPLHMPATAARTFVEIIEVKAERLKDISEEDAVLEGIRPLDIISHNGQKAYDNYVRGTAHYCTNAIDSFSTLWQSIHGPESWEANPWVWAYSFKRIDKPENL